MKITQKMPRKMPRKMPAIFLSIFCSILLVSCQAKNGNKATVNLYSGNINKGSSLYDIVQIYGNYSDNWQDEFGNNIYQYYYTKHRYDLISQLPIINHFGWINSENYEVLLVFNKKDLLIEERKFYNRAKSRNSLVCNPKIYSCLRKIY